MARREVALGGELGELVPRAHELAVVAAVDAVAQRLAELRGNRGAQLDRQIRNATRRVQLVRRDDRAGRTDIDAGTAGAAVVGRRLIERQRQVGEDLAKKEPRAGVAMEQVGVLADPAEAGVARERFLQDRAAVDEHTVRARGAVRADFLGELREPSAQHFVIVAAERVAGHVRTLGIAEHFVRIACLRWQVVHARCDDSQRSRDQLLRPGAAAAVPLHVVHGAVPALLQPAHQSFFVRGDVDARYAHLLKAELAAPLADRARQLRQRRVGRFVAHTRGSIRFGRLRP